MNVRKVQLNNSDLNSAGKPNVSNLTQGLGTCSPAFHALHVSPETLNKIGCTREMLLNVPNIKKCAEKYDVLVTAGEKKYRAERYDGYKKDKLFPLVYLIGTVWSAPHVAEWLNALGVYDMKIIIGTCAAMFGGAMLSMWKLVTQKLHTMIIQGAQEVKLSETSGYNSTQYSEPKPSGIISEAYEIKKNNGGTIENVPDMAEYIEDMENELFHNDCLNNAQLDDMYTPESYLKNLQQIQEKAKRERIKDVFSYPVNKGGDTLLTMFFDVVIPKENDSEEKLNAYKKILEEIAKTDKKNFDQKDSNGISILEKIMRSENLYILPYIKGVKFSYSPFLVHTYNSILNQEFKNQLKNSIDFKFDLLENNNENKKNR